MKLMQLSLGATDHPPSEKNPLLLFPASQPRKKIPLSPWSPPAGESQLPSTVCPPFQSLGGEVTHPILSLVLGH